MQFFGQQNTLKLFAANCVRWQQKGIRGAGESEENFEKSTNASVQYNAV